MRQMVHREEITRVHVASPYIHALNGRLRIKVAEVKGSPVKALEVERRLRTVDGVSHVTANPTTGNVLVLYAPERIAQHDVIDALRRLGYLQQGGAVQAAAGGHLRPLDGLGDALAETLVRTTVELALQRLVSALI